ncbi:hypothetical protein [Cognataquiflexum rubidum]|uniref:hypothetical protein n=1 Tax=Cognataquiflexum rubidum TaxID=2922273 RepID=UPI001F138712|nr:hypothetical protein [Cognataquiflexum rubidum]MCH6234498.1 hypothetical protein [Cognataquiflexum rubidum]
MEVVKVKSELKQKEEQINQKLNKIIASNIDPFPFDRINKAKKLIAMIHECQKHIESDNLLLAGMKLRDLELEGLVLKGG